MAGFGAHPLIGAGLQEFSDPQTAAVAGGAPGRENMIRANRLVSIGDSRFLADEQRAVVGEALEKRTLVLHVEFQVFRRVIVAEFDSFAQRIGDIDQAVITPGERSDVAGWKD